MGFPPVIESSPNHSLQSMHGVNMRTRHRTNSTFMCLGRAVFAGRTLARRNVSVISSKRLFLFLCFWNFGIVISYILYGISIGGGNWYQKEVFKPQCTNMTRGDAGKFGIGFTLLHKVSNMSKINTTKQQICPLFSKIFWKNSLLSML